MDTTNNDVQIAPGRRERRRPRHRWLKRIGLMIALSLVALVALRVWWSWEAGRRLRAKIDEYRAAGQPVLLQDFAMPSVADADNAALLLRKAAAALVEPDDVPISIADVIDAPQVVNERPKEVALLIEANAEALRLVRGVRAKPKADWGVRLASPVVNVTLPDLRPQKDLARVCCVAALYHHQQGSNHEAIAAVRDILDIADRVGQMGPFLIAHLVRLAITDLAVTAIEGIAYDLQVQAVINALEETALPAPHKQVQSLIAELLDQQEVRTGWKMACYGERLMLYDAGEIVSSTKGDLWWLFRPAFRLDTVRMMEYSTAAAHAGLAPDWPAADKLLPRYETAQSGVEMLTRLPSNLLLPALDNALVIHYHSLLRQRLAATALAIRLYAADHGVRPPTLDALVPDYLPMVPKDPFAADGRVICYRPDATPPVLYSVGTDGVDEGGRYAFEPGQTRDWDSADIVFFLDGHRPPHAATRMPSSQAVDDDVNQPGPERQPD